MILFLYGEDSYRLTARLRLLREAFQKKFDAQGLSVTRIDGEMFDMTEFRKQTKSVGLFSTKRFVELHNPWVIKKEEQTLIEEGLKTLTDDTILCVIAPPPPKTTLSLFKALLQSHTVEEYPLLNPQQLRTFIRERAKTYGGSIDSAAVEYLASTIGNDLWEQDTEIKKLVFLNNHITHELATRMVVAEQDSRIFDLTDALGEKNHSRASLVLRKQYENGASTQLILTMLARHISLLWKVKKTDGSKLSAHPYAIQKATSQQKRFSEEELKQLYQRLLAIDAQMKTAVMNDRLLIELFLCEGTRASSTKSS